MKKNPTPKKMDAGSRLHEVIKERNIYAEALADTNLRFSEKVKELSILWRIGNSISSSLDEKIVCESLVSILTSEMTAENCSLMLFSEDGKELVLKAAQSQTETQPRYYGGKTSGSVTRIKVGEGVAGWVARTGKPLLIKDTKKDKRFKNLEGGLKDIKSLLCMPIKGKEGTIGVLNLSHPDIGSFSKENERILSLLVNQAALAFNNIRLFARIKRFNEELEQTVAQRTAELRYSEEKYKSLMKYGSDAVLIISPKTGEILECNNMAYSIFGGKERGCQGAHVKNLFPPDQEKLADKLLSLPKSRKKSLKMDSWIEKAGKDSAIHVSVNSNVIPLKDGNVIHTTLRDITERVMLEKKRKEYSVRLEKEVKQRTKELRETQDELLNAAKLAALGEMASGVAHEINNPIAVMRGHAEDLKDQIMANEPLPRRILMESLDSIIASADRCGKITDEVLNFSRPRPNSIEPCALEDIIESSISLAGPKLRKSNIAVKVEADKKTILETDKGHMEQVLINLLNNAIDASPVDSSIEIKARERRHLLLLEIIDHGVGIPRKYINKIFDPFFSTKGPGRGTGLGLSICYRIIEKLGGKIKVSSRKGRTAFSITLPLTAKQRNTK